LVGSMAAFVALLPSLMHGQSMDYGAFEQLFKEPVTTSVDGSPQRVSDVPATMEIITAEEIRRSGAKDIPGVLRHAAGVDITEWGNDNIDVGVRGYNQAYSARLLVLVDGRQVYADTFGGVPWSAVPVSLDAIRQIEIIKGPSSALFGFNAVSGVINIITYNPLFDKANTTAVTVGTQGLTGASSVQSHRFGDKAAVLVSVGGNVDGDFSTVIPVFEALTLRQREYRAAININGAVRLNDKVELGIEASHADARLNEMMPLYQINNTRYQTDSVKGRFTSTSSFGLLQAKAYTNLFTETNSSAFVTESLVWKNWLTVAEFSDVAKLGTNHTLRAAAEYRYSTEATTPITGATIHYGVLSSSGMWSWRITPSISLTNALRVDHVTRGRDGTIPPGYPFTNSDWSRSFTPLSFNSGLVWKPSEADSLRIALGRGTELPALVISGTLLEVGPVVSVSGTPFLKLSVMTNYEISWEHVIASSHMLLRVSAFDQKSDNVLAFGGGFIPTPSGAYLTPSNVGDSNARGLEVEIKGTLPQNYRWNVSYRPERISDNFVPAARDGAAFLDYEDTTPIHLAKANLGWASGRWEIDSFLRYQSSAYGIQPTAQMAIIVPVKGFVAVDGRVAYNLTDWATWSVSGQNLTHASQTQTSGPQLSVVYWVRCRFTFKRTPVRMTTNSAIGGSKPEPPIFPQQ
jgi:outer membrane receptor for ferrienterochelin and colicins